MWMKVPKLDQAQQVAGVQKKQDRAKDGPLWDTIGLQHQCRLRTVSTTADELFAAAKVRSEPVDGGTTETERDGEEASRDRRCRTRPTNPAALIRRDHRCQQRAGCLREL